MSSELIFVTGASGYLGAHIVHQLLEKGYRVRGTARGAKVGLARQGLASYGDRFEIVNVDNVATDDVSEHLKGVTAVIHTAAPLPSGGDAEFILKGTIEGSVNIIRQAEKAGVKKIIYTSSIGAVFNRSGSLTAADWNPMTYDQAVQSNAFIAYGAAKSLAEKAVWDFVDTHKHLEVTSFCPPLFYGPFAPGVSIAPNDYSAISTTKLIHGLLTPAGNFPPSAGYIDVRDLARAHVGALTSPPESAIGRKRLPVASPHELNYKTAVEFIGEKRPELMDRLVDANKAPKFPFDKIALDLKRVEEVTGVKSDSYIPWQNTILETVDDLVKMEKDWAGKGVSVEIPVA